jgi:hypothetical protein
VECQLWELEGKARGLVFPRAAECERLSGALVWSVRRESGTSFEKPSSLGGGSRFGGRRFLSRMRHEALAFGVIYRDAADVSVSGHRKSHVQDIDSVASRVQVSTLAWLLSNERRRASLA